MEKIIIPFSKNAGHLLISRDRGTSDENAGLSLHPTFSSWGSGGTVSPPAGSGARNFFSYTCSGQRQFSTVSFSGFGLWVRVRVLGSDNLNRVPNSNPNLNHNSNRNLTLTPILTPNSN